MFQIYDGEAKLVAVIKGIFLTLPLAMMMCRFLLIKSEENQKKSYDMCLYYEKICSEHKLVIFRAVQVACSMLMMLNTC